MEIDKNRLLKTYNELDLKVLQSKGLSDYEKYVISNKNYEAFGLDLERVPNPELELSQRVKDE